MTDNRKPCCQDILSQMFIRVLTRPLRLFRWSRGYPNFFANFQRSHFCSSKLGNFCTTLKSNIYRKVMEIIKKKKKIIKTIVNFVIYYEKNFIILKKVTLFLYKNTHYTISCKKNTSF